MLTTTISRTNGVAVVSVSGSIYFGDESTCLRTMAKDLLKETHRIVFDLENVTHIDSGGVGALVAAYASARQARGELKFSNLSAHTQKRSCRRQIFSNCLRYLSRRTMRLHRLTRPYVVVTNRCGQHSRSIVTCVSSRQPTRIRLN